MQRRSHTGEEYGDPIDFKADAEKGIFAGHSSVFWSVDSYGECTAPGCFQQTIAERGPQGSNRILTRYEHAVTIGAKQVLKEDAVGLYEESKISATTAGNDVKALLGDGVIMGLSIGFRRVGYRTATDADPLVLDNAPKWAQSAYTEDPANIIVLTEVKLFETSVVTFPAVDDALVESYRSQRWAGALSSLLTDLKAGRLSDEERAALQELADAWLADGGAGKGETPDPADVTRTASRRRHDLEAALLLAQAKAWGVDIGAAA